MKKLLYLLILLVSFSSFGQSKNLFEQGKELYKNGKYQQSINVWMQILDKGEHSAELYFNLGNAQYKLNHIGPSVYYYEKALQLSPNDADIKNNLAFAENARIDAIEPLPKTVFSKWYKSVAGIFTFNGWATLAVVLSLLFVTLFLLYYFSYTEKRKRLLFVASMFAGLVLVASLAMSFLTYGDFTKNQPAIIFASEIEVKTEPSMGSNVAFTLHEGTKVQISAQDGNWYRISLADGKDGWIPSSDLKQL
ncbi:tetratricopeptide repeat protein,SH3 domain-containing protein [Aequorivita sublithincola DSM 14238]|uniref:Tetratricopeptide repeat protein,SH3 domain-containing protein n=1 Tax=Aequorivita sublithincola (strain DSM 14238 / LMG 21431 / ACAM 643 / 9-3) TaxID=746697 RepID=I3YUE5_AEQSU|nr:SH3 domain-containing protein [Aequorivita sublithincola]AFL80613.1 tetratricopeptide repeat protein,SH3 domain-containing protein [Aequorivita sublithincola DSM 14238]